MAFHPLANSAVFKGPCVAVFSQAVGNVRGGPEAEPARPPLPEDDSVPRVERGEVQFFPPGFDPAPPSGNRSPADADRPEEAPGPRADEDVKAPVRPAPVVPFFCLFRWRPSPFCPACPSDCWPAPDPF